MLVRRENLRTCLLGLAALLVAALPGPAGGQAVEDYRFVQLTSNRGKDRLPRVTLGGRALLIWAGKFSLPGSTSSGSDFEIVSWDGHLLEQLSDDDVEDTRPVINNRRQAAWQRFGQGPESEIVVRRFTGDHGWLEEQITVDNLRDRYPDLNDDGWVVWGRRERSVNTFASYRLGDTGFRWLPGVRSYRPHINAQGHVGISGTWIRDTAGHLIQELSPGNFGYPVFRRSENNDLDQFIIEAVPKLPQPDKAGPRDILFWDGQEMTLVYRSPVYAGRGDLNNTGVAVFEGRGGLGGSRSSPSDLEIFVYLSGEDELIQLTDNDVDDQWPTVTADGTIVWQSKGTFVGAAAGQFNGTVQAACCDAILAALPIAADYDGDGAPNRVDNCPVTYNPGQADGDGDGLGNACDGRCGQFLQVADCSQAMANPGLPIIGIDPLAR